jgi:hypothetical protein
MITIYISTSLFPSFRHLCQRMPCCSNQSASNEDGDGVADEDGARKEETVCTVHKDKLATKGTVYSV